MPQLPSGCSVLLGVVVGFSQISGHLAIKYTYILYIVEDGVIGCFNKLKPKSELLKRCMDSHSGLGACLLPFSKPTTGKIMEHIQGALGEPDFSIMRLNLFRLLNRRPPKSSAFRGLLGGPGR